MMLEVVGVSSGYPSYAGHPAYGFVPEYIPFAERDGYLLVTDMRAGSNWGEVLKYDKVSADEDPKKWTSLTYMFDELIAAIANGSEFDGWTADVTDGELTWDLEGGPRDRLLMWLFSLVAIFSISACAAAVPNTVPSSVPRDATPTVLVRAFVEVLNAHDVEAAKRLLSPEVEQRLESSSD